MLHLAVFDVSYVAENYENLHHILVYFTASGGTSGVDIEAEVSAPPSPHELELGCEFLQLRSGASSSRQLLLPGYATIGKKDVKVQGSHFEVKLHTVPFISESSSSHLPSLRTLHHDLADSNKALLDASQLTSLNPTSFICTSCSLPLIHSTKIDDYRDLPSEHWEELVEAWMCHSDQKLHDHVVQHGRHGFWPKDGQALVGGSYILFRESAINQNNLHASRQNQVSTSLLLHLYSSSLSRARRCSVCFGRRRRPALDTLPMTRSTCPLPRGLLISWVTVVIS